jgi:hypothetical protein
VVAIALPTESKATTDNTDPRGAELAALDRQLETLQQQAFLLLMETAGVPKMRDELMAQFEELLNNAIDEEEKPLPQRPATPMNGGKGIEQGPYATRKFVV